MENYENQNRLFLLTFIKIIPFIFGIIIVGIGVFLFSLNADFLTNSNTVIGEIISYEQVLRIDRTEETQKKPKIMYQMTISYIVNNEEFTFSPSAYTKSVPAIGKKIKVYHLIEDPWDARLTSELFLFPVIFVLIGIIILCVNLILFIKRKSSSS
ncbi:MAG: DUF3592 domain-containing protein [Spirochaetales bacterium]|nr:DUF3592 domain-containing protein [Spirochaetales bacterium]